MFLVSSSSCLCPIHWSQVLSAEWRCSWSSADRRCSNYIWVFNNFIAKVRLIFEVLWTLRKKLQWNFNQNTNFFIHENALENVVYEMAAIFSKMRWVNFLIAMISHIILPVRLSDIIYGQTSNIRCTKSQNLNVSCLVSQLSLLNPLKPGIKSRMKM